MVGSTRRPASRARSLTAPRSRLIRAWVGARSSGSGLRAAPMERLATSVRGPRLRDRELCVWSFAIRMLRMLAGDDCAAFTRIGRCDSRVDHSGRPPIVARVTPYATATHPHRPDARRRIRCPLRPRRPDNHARDLCACDSTSRPRRAGGSQAVIQDVGKAPKRPQPRYPRREPKRSIPRQFRSGRYWARTSDLVLARSQRGLSDHDRAVICAANPGFSSRAATA